MEVLSRATTPAKVVTAMGETIHEMVGRNGGSRSERHSVAHVVIPPGRFARRHYHPHAEESYHVLQGTGWVELGDEVCSLSAGESVLIPEGVPHKIANGSEENLVLIVICVPPWHVSNSVWLENDEMVPAK